MSLALLLSAVLAAPQSEWPEPTPPPLVPAPASPTVAPGAGAAASRSARLLEDSREGRRLRSLRPLPAWKVGLRMLTATLGTGVGAGLATLFVFGFALSGGGASFGAGTSGTLNGLLFAVPVVLALTSAFTALGAALFGADYAFELTRAFPVAVGAVLLSSLLLLTSSAIGWWAVPLACLAAGILTPAFIEVWRAVERGDEERRRGVVLAQF